LSEAKSGDLVSSSLAAPGFISLNPGYKEKLKEAERRQARISNLGTTGRFAQIGANRLLRVRLALKRSALAYRRSTPALAAAN
jgi:hypothetical protein